jgi:hypothetical protein
MLELGQKTITLGKILKNFNKYLLIKYEDLVNNTEETFLKF